MRAQDVLRSPGGYAIFMVLGLEAGNKAEERVRKLCSGFAAIARSMRGRFPAEDVSCVMGFGAAAWLRLFPGRGKPRELETFKEIKGAKYTAVTGTLFLFPPRSFWRHWEAIKSMFQVHAKAPRGINLRGALLFIIFFNLCLNKL